MGGEYSCLGPWKLGCPHMPPPDFSLQESYNAALTKSKDIPADADDSMVGTPPPSPLVSSAFGALVSIDTLSPLDALPDLEPATPQPTWVWPPSLSQPTSTPPTSSSASPDANATAKGRSKKSLHEWCHAK